MWWGNAYNHQVAADAANVFAKHNVTQQQNQQKCLFLIERERENKKREREKQKT